MLGLYAFSQVIFSPVIGIIADRTERRKTMFLVALFSGLGGTVLFALSTNIGLLYLARLIQGLSGVVVWIVGFAMLADTVGAANMGKTLGIVTVFMNSANFTGPMTGGLLLETIGYYPTWCVPMAVLLVDIVMRILMVDASKNRSSRKSAETWNAAHPQDTTDSCCDDGTCFGTKTICTSGQNSPASSPISGDFPNEPDLVSSATFKFPGLTVMEEVVVTYEPNPHYTPPVSPATSPTDEGFNEISPLIAHGKPDKRAEPSCTELTTLQFYLFLSTQRRIIASLFSILTYSILVSSFDATLPLHVQEAFGWGSSGSGAMFLALQAPGIIFGPLAGWLRDSTLLNYFLPRSLVVIDELEASQPGIFGPGGAYSRLYSVSSMIYTVGTFIGPEISGYLKDKLGYGNMNLALGNPLPGKPSLLQI
ncbi:hypothetical protein FGG08_004712 [Glutinoglossum americanum]|uniref:Major facilitator superfamily (MFS) profile domain-containing protein n=1 Tax=Glutinoglossum americanum TaxID=1670608 RepID=A0A9P8KWR7_9PEZI|nr:hypothetical protein FGG08_004712 [Glutinoglossum americanum]